MANGQVISSRLAHREGPAAAVAGGHSDRELLTRFVQSQDQTAFRTLVQRHGPMVLSVCRRVLDHEQDAEDAFQAAFLVLARRAGSLENPELLGGWLYGVAQDRAQGPDPDGPAAQQRRAVAMTGADEAADDLAWRELRATLDEELNRLPEKYRLPLILCYLQGLTNEEAARRLGWPVGSISYRLARGRELLRQRMRARGREAPAGVFAVLLALNPGSAAVRGGLVESTVQAAGGQAGATAVVSERVAGLVDAVLRSPSWGRKVLAALPLLLVAALALGAAALYAASEYSSDSSAPTQQTAPPCKGCRHSR